MPSDEHNNPQTTEIAPTPEKKGFTNRQKIVAAMSTLIVAVVVGGGILYEHNNDTPKTAPTEQSSGDNNSSSATNTNKEKPKTIKSYDPKKDPNVSYKHCPDPKADSCTIEYHDPGSGAIIATMPNIGPEMAMNDVNTIVTGLDRFTEIGIQKPQRDKLWKDFIDYGSSQDTLIKEISVTVASIKKINTEADDSRSINFEITTDRVTKLHAEIIYSGSSTLELKIFNPEDNTLLYDSVK